MRKLLLVSDDPLHQCAFYRLWPFLSDSFRLVEGESLSSERFVYSFAAHTMTPAGMLPYDVIFFLRPTTEYHVGLIRAANQLGKRIWVDYDDDFLNMGPHQNGAEDMLSVAAIKRFHIIGQLADAFTVSTLKLESSFAEVAAVRPVTIPNAFNNDRYCLPAGSNAGSKTIVWRGAHGHLFEIDVLAELVGRFPDYKFVFIGSVHRDLPAKVPSATFYPFMPMAQYFALMNALAPRAVLVPLASTPFNEAKSNCAWIEATHVGAVTVASPLAEFNRPGIELAVPVLGHPMRDPWAAAIDRALTNSVDNWRKSAACIRSELLVTKVNATRRHLFASLF